jgi:hypothetical protein
MACLVQQASLNGCCSREVLCRSSRFTYWVSLYQNQRDCWWERIYWHNRKCHHATAPFCLVVKRIVRGEWEHFTWAMGFLGCISDSNGDITLKIHTWHFLRMLYKRRIFGWDRSLCYRRSITKGTLLDVHSNFSVSIAGILVQINISNIPCMRYRRCKFGSNRSVIKSTLIGERCAFSAVPRFPFKGLSW